MKREKAEDVLTDDEILNHPLVQAAFQDPRYRHLRSLGDMQDSEPAMVGYDRALTLQALSAIYGLVSAENQSSALARATWALFAATIALVLATVVLIFTS